MNIKEQGLLEKRKQRCIATILSVKDKECSALSNDASSALRKVILDEINEFYLLVVDLMENNINEEYLDMFAMLEDIHEVVTKRE